MMQQGAPTVPVADSGRIFTGFWLLFTIIISVTYMGNLFAFLFSPQIEFPINSLDIMVKKGAAEGITWGVLGGSVIEQYLQTSTEPKFRDIEEQAMTHTSDQIAADGSLYDQIKKEEHVYIEWMSKLEMISEEQYKITKSCDYALGEEEFFHERVALAFPKGSPWFGRFNHYIEIMF